MRKPRVMDRRAGSLPQQEAQLTHLPGGFSRGQNLKESLLCLTFSNQSKCPRNVPRSSLLPNSRLFRTCVEALTPPTTRLTYSSRLRPSCTARCVRSLVRRSKRRAELRPPSIRSQNFAFFDWSGFPLFHRLHRRRRRRLDFLSGRPRPPPHAASQLTGI